MRLEEIQKDFVDALFGKDSETAGNHVSEDATLSPEQRIGIYRGSVHGILTQSLALTFPVCKQLLGDTFFDRMCDEFIDHYPPTSTFFAHYGNNFPVFIKNFEPVEVLPYLHDISMLEWTRHIVWHQKLPQSFDYSSLAELSEEQQANLTFELNSTLHLLQSEYRIDQLWFAHQDDSKLKIEEIDLEKSVKLLIWKGLDGIKITDIDKENSLLWDFLHAIAELQTITQLAEKFGDTLPEALNKSIQKGWIQSFEIN